MSRKLPPIAIGSVFNSLTVIGDPESYISGGRPKWRYMCRCECGNQKRIDRNCLVRGMTRSCGCLRKTVVKGPAMGPRKPRKIIDPPIYERLMSRVVIVGECWEFQGALRNGYAILGTKRKMVYGHRLSYEQNVGPIPDGLYVLHHCDNRKCVRPKHLYAGTPKDNSKDAVARGRINRPKGEGHCCAKLTDAVIPEIIIRRRSGETLQSLADQFGVTTSTISLVCQRKTWRHVG